MSDHNFYAEQSRVTEPGMFAARVEEVAGSLSDMRRAAGELVFHYRADGDFAENGIAAERIAEIDTRYAEDMLARLVELADQPLGADRRPCDRLVGCCRDFTVLFLSITRAHDVPARARSVSRRILTPAGTSITWLPRSGTKGSSAGGSSTPSSPTITPTPPPALRSTSRT